MPISFVCERCKRHVRVSRGQAGMDWPCPGCGESTHVPQIETLGTLDHDSQVETPPVSPGNPLLSDAAALLARRFREEHGAAPTGQEARTELINERRDAPAFNTLTQTLPPDPARQDVPPSVVIALPTLPPELARHAASPLNAAASVALDEVECSQCAEWIKAKAKICRFCGYAFAPSHPPASRQYEAPRRRRRHAEDAPHARRGSQLTCGGLALALLAIAGTVFLGLFVGPQWACLGLFVAALIGTVLRFNR